MTRPSLLCHCKSITTPHLPTHYSKSRDSKPQSTPLPHLQHWLTRERFPYNMIKTELHQNLRIKLLVLFMRLWSLILERGHLQGNQQIQRKAGICVLVLFQRIFVTHDLKGTERWTRCWRLMDSSPFGPVKPVSIFFFFRSNQKCFIREKPIGQLSNY